MALTGAVALHNHSSGASGGVLSAIQQIDEDVITGSPVTPIAGIATNIVTSKAFTGQIADWYLVEAVMTGTYPATSSRVRVGLASGQVQFVPTASNPDNDIHGHPISTLFEHAALGGFAVNLIANSPIFNLVWTHLVGVGAPITGFMRVKQFRNTLAP